MYLYLNVVGIKLPVCSKVAFHREGSASPPSFGVPSFPIVVRKC